MNSEPDQLNAINFILDKINYFHRNISKLSKNEDFKKDLTAMLPIKNGGVVICGLDAMKKLHNLARDEYFSNQELSFTVTLEAYTDQIRKQFVSIFYEEKADLNKENLRRMFASSHSTLKEKFKSRTFFIPCLLFSHSSPKELSIGPISFMHSSLFRELYDEKFKIDISSSEEISERSLEQANILIFTSDKAKKKSNKVKIRYLTMAGKKADQKIFEKYINSIASYNWLARIRISPAEIKLSERQANYIIEQGLNVMRMILGEGYSHKLKRDIAAKEPYEIFRIYLNEEDIFEYTASSKSKEHHGENWHDALSVGDFEIRIFGEILTRLSNFQVISNAEERLLDALTWYGEAIAEQSPGIKIVKFMSTFERLTLTGERNQVTQHIVQRAAWLIKSCWDEDHGDEIQNLYELRSRLIHGDKSPWDRSIDQSVITISKLTRKLLVSALRFFTDCQENEEAPLTKEAIKKHYDELCPIQKRNKK